MTKDESYMLYAHWSKKSDTPKPTPKKTQTISAKSFTKTYGGKSFKIGAKAKTKLSYKSGDNKVATVSSSGKVTIKGIGKVTITITAKGNSVYKPATKKITITVNPKSIKVKQKIVDKYRNMYVKWYRIPKATGYEVKYSNNKKIPNSGLTAKFNFKAEKTAIKNKNLKSTAYIKVRAYTRYKGKNYYSKWKLIIAKVK